MVLVVLSGVSGSGTIGAVVLSDPVVLAVLSNAIYIIIYIYIYIVVLVVLSAASLLGSH